MPDPRPAAQTLCEPAVAMHFNMSQEPLHGNLQPQTKSKHGASLRNRNARGNAGAQMEHPDQTSAFTLTVRTLSVGKLFGEFLLLQTQYLLVKSPSLQVQPTILLL